MPYHIEIMSLGEDLYSLLERAAASLNGIQDRFRFEMTQPSQRAPGLALSRNAYLTTDVYDFLQAQRAAGGAPRPFIIAFLTKPLSSPRIGNLFGSHRGEEGMAIVTTAGTAQYVKEDERYCRYYMVRYALSFVNWTIKAHHDEARKDCYFNFKGDKREIIRALDTGHICDPCMAQLDNPPVGSTVHRLTDDERVALLQMRQLVAGDYPYSIVMKGGGVKGLALAGALVELGNFYSFNRHVGTSAGAIAAVLLAADYKPGELVEIFRKKDFTDFLDAPWWMLPINLIFRQGLYPGEAFRLWIADKLTTKLRKQAEVRMEHLDRAVIYAARAGQGTLTFDSKGSHRDAVASFAVRCSMAIPLFFTPTSVDGRRVFDGGLRNNFPLKKFIEAFPGKPFIAIYLGKPDNRNDRSFGTDILDIVVDGEERELVDSMPNDVAVIDTSPIGTIDFRMTDKEKEFLLAVGRVSALELLLRRNLDGGPSEQAVAALRQQVEDMRAAIIKTRRIRRTKRNWRRGLLTLALVVALALWRYWLRRYR